jgi:hypothetical protein
MTGINAAFGKPFKQQVAAFRLRLANLAPTAKWTDIWQAEHDRAFMVAGALKADLLADLAAAVDKAIEKGTTLETFRKDFREIVARNGWEGYTGSTTERGRAWRTKLIYKTNLLTSYAAGRFAQLTAANYAFWIYFHGASLEPREQHLAWDGLILPPDHPFWLTHAPPNGWGCSCYIIGARTMEGAIRRGGKPGLKLPDNWQALDPRTGAPVGIDKGWAYAPGASVAQTVTSLAAKLDALPEQPSVAMIQSWLKLESFATWMQAATGNWPLARINAVQAEMIGSKTNIAQLSAETAAKQLARHPELTALDYLQVQRVIEAATFVIQDTPRSLVYLLAEEGANGYVLVVKATISGNGLFVTSFRRLSADAARQDREVARLIAKGQT